MTQVCDIVGRILVYFAVFINRGLSSFISERLAAFGRRSIYCPSENTFSIGFQSFIRYSNKTLRANIQILFHFRLLYGLKGTHLVFYPPILQSRLQKIDIRNQTLEVRGQTLDVRGSQTFYARPDKRGSVPLRASRASSLSSHSSSSSPTAQPLTSNL